MNRLGLIGFPLGHSFSRKYFTEKFAQENIRDFSYSLFEIESLDNFREWAFSIEGLHGLNVTIPYKVTIIPFLDELSEEAAAIGAVNTIKLEGNKFIGFNTDARGFESSFIHETTNRELEKEPCLILGSSGGAAKAVEYILKKNNYPFTRVSRHETEHTITYAEVNKQTLREHPIIINCTPLGMYPNVEAKPDLPYSALTPRHHLYDLIYNPLETAFLKAGMRSGASTQNGLKMLRLQAEFAWHIWTSNSPLDN